MSRSAHDPSATRERARRRGPYLLFVLVVGGAIAVLLRAHCTFL